MLNDRVGVMGDLTKSFERNILRPDCIRILLSYKLLLCLGVRKPCLALLTMLASSLQDQLD